MKKSLQLAAILTLATALSAPSLFAEERHGEWTNDGAYGRIDRRTVTLEGRIRDIDRERNGFVIELDRGGHRLFAANGVDVRNRAGRDGRLQLRQLERGDVIRARGTYGARGVVHVSAIEVVRDSRNARSASLSGIVESVDRERGMLWIREDRSRRVVGVEMGRFERQSDGYGYDFRDVRRGDRVTVRGEWRNDRFLARDVDRDARW